MIFASGSSPEMLERRLDDGYGDDGISITRGLI
jgi:hypothetical protein